MTLTLQTIPSDVLEHIAFFSFPTSAFEPPSDILNLLLTCHLIHDSLSVPSCPQLYAKVFHTRFDIDPTRRIADGLTDSILAAELVQRHRVLRRVRRRDTSQETLVQDLSTALAMILENVYLNQAQLSTAGISVFIVDVVLRYLEEAKVTVTRCSLYGQHLNLALWLAALTLSSGDVKAAPEELRDNILSLLCPFISRNPNKMLSEHPTAGTGGFAISRSLADYPECPKLKTSQHIEFQLSRMKSDATCAAIILAFAYKEVDVLQAPPHLPLNRTEALAALRSGPTKEDYEDIAAFRTPLWADTRLKASPRVIVTTCENSDIYQCHSSDSYGSLAASDRKPSLAGVWNGIYMVSPFGALESSDQIAGTCQTADFLCRTPLQCALDVHICSSPDEAFITDDPRRIGSFKHARDVPGRITTISRYNKCDPLRCDKRSLGSGNALNYILTGETLDKHEEAWSGFRYSGRVLDDGTIVLKREPKNTGAEDPGLGTWIFEGKIIYGSAFVGRWRSLAASGEPSIQGIFSMRKEE
ncbi:hypothetical protein C8J56DRAFT_475965 [Mycena floridula]|nr:hypothetical protein C8J56DRAFT_475965 [Mycena floridula]